MNVGEVDDGKVKEEDENKEAKDDDVLINIHWSISIIYCVEHVTAYQIVLPYQ